MFLRLSALVYSALLFGSIGLAQDAAPVNDWRPAVTNQDGKEYPHNSEGRVKFRINDFILGTAEPGTQRSSHCSRKFGNRYGETTLSLLNIEAVASR